MKDRSIPRRPEREPAMNEAPLANEAEAPYPVDFVRQPFGEEKLKLTAEVRPGFRRYWFKDYLDRIERAKKAGYVHVTENGRPIQRGGGGRNDDGTPVVLYLMEIPLKWFQEDMAAHQRKVDEIDDAIKGGAIGQKDDDHRYVPKHAIKYDPRQSARSVDG